MTERDEREFLCWKAQGEMGASSSGDELCGLSKQASRGLDICDQSCRTVDPLDNWRT